MKFLAILGLILCITPAQASTDLTQWHLLELRESYIDYFKYADAVIPFLSPTYIPNQSINLHFNLDLFDKVVFIDNMVNSTTDQTQFRLVGWQYRLGFHIGDSIDLYFQHHSQHILDAPAPMSNVYDAVGVRVYLFKK